MHIQLRTQSRRLLPILFFVGAIALGCGGGGSGGSGSTTATAFTTTGSSTTGSTTSTNGSAGASVTITPATTPAQITQPQPTIMLTASSKGVPNATYTWGLVGQVVQQGVGQFAFPQTLPAIGYLQTVDGQPFPTGPTTLTQAVYVVPPYRIGFGSYDTVALMATGSPTGFAETRLNIPLGSDYSTLPKPVSILGLAGMTLDKSTYKPGDTINAVVSIQPGVNNTSTTVDTPFGFIPSSVTVNGAPVTIPYTISYKNSSPAFMLNVSWVIPASQGNEFPVTSGPDPQTGSVGYSGSWVLIDGAGGSGGWEIQNPFFIHS